MLNTEARKVLGGFAGRNGVRLALRFGGSFFVLTGGRLALCAIGLGCSVEVLGATLSAGSCSLVSANPRLGLGKLQ